VTLDSIVSIMDDDSIQHSVYCSLTGGISSHEVERDGKVFGKKKAG
jgi:hypothetical protein